MIKTLLVTDNVIRPQQCELYRGHTCAVVNKHHICPESWWHAAGVLVDTPMIVLCPNCHYNTHAAIDGMIRERDLHCLPPRCIKLAEQAFTLALAAGLTPALTL